MSIILGFLFLAGVAVPPISVHAANISRMESDISTSIFTQTLDMINFDGDDIQGIGAYILHNNDELWGYIAGFDADPTNLAYGQVLTNVVAFAYSTRSISHFSPPHAKYPHVTGLALRADGTVWYCAIRMIEETYELYAHAVQVGSDAVKVSGYSFLTANGDVYVVHRSHQVETILNTYLVPPSTVNFGGVDFFVALVAQNIADIAYDIYLPANRLLELEGRSIANVQQFFARPLLSFALTAEGRLYGWGRNTTGNVGVGAVGDSGWHFVVQRPRFVLEDVATVYIDDHHVYARDTSGQLWIWGGGEPARLGQHADGRSTANWPDDRTHLRPRLAEYNAPRYTAINGVSIRPDGTLWVQTIDRMDWNNRITHDIQLPINFNQVMGGGTTAPPSHTLHRFEVIE